MSETCDRCGHPPQTLDDEDEPEILHPLRECYGGRHCLVCEDWLRERGVPSDQRTLEELTV